MKKTSYRFAGSDNKYTGYGQYGSKHYYSKAGLTKAESIWAVMIIVLCFTLCLCGAFLNRFSGIFSGKKTTNINISSRCFYAVSAGEFVSLTDARIKAAVIRTGQGAGYIFGKDVFTVLMSVYKEESEASRVAGNNSGFVYKFDVPEIKVNIEAEATEIMIINSTLKMFYALTDRLIEMSVSLDKSGINEAEALALLLEEEDLLIVYKSNIKENENLNSSVLGNQLLTAIDYSIDAVKTISDINNLEQEIPSKLRNSTIKILHNYQKLFLSLK